MPRHSPYALLRLNLFLVLESNFFELLEFRKQIFRLSSRYALKKLSLCFSRILMFFPPLGEIVFTLLGKTKFLLTIANLVKNFVLLICSFLLFNILYSVFNEHNSFLVKISLYWSAWMDSNHRPHAYQACALTT